MARVNANEINISELTLKEKVGQMVMIKANDGLNEEFISLGVGGIFLNGGKTSDQFKEIIDEYQNASKIKLLVATDMEGYWNPFSDKESKSFGEITNANEAKALGKEHAETLKNAGFNIDFSPVVESKNKVWPGRSFTGTPEERKEKITAYINALQKEGIIATAKHYPGGSMEKNPHWRLVKAEIDKEDLENFDIAIQSEVKAIMIGHAIVHGEIGSNKKPATASPEVIAKLRENFSGLIITDDINMLGLRLKYLFQRKKMCVDLAKAGNDIILDSWKTKPSSVEKCIKAIVNSVNSGEIPEKRIDESVTRIFEAKGYNVIS
ncbi:MAG: glycoside hydrolase family 3 N-terminal domain-containing protein [archaeon]